METATDDDLLAPLAKFGLERFRPGQRDVIRAVLQDQDCLCIMPTGGGKSLCYQLPAIVRAGVTLVISPLIALMKDQVDSLRQKGIAADFLNSSLTSQEQGQRLDRLSAGKYRLLYVAPERFRSQRFLEILRQVGVQLMAVDEAHCISEWGHDFRHDYTRLGQYRKMIGTPPTIALTATATPDVQIDIAQQLELSDPRTFVAGFARPNLRYHVQLPSSKNAKLKTLQSFLQTTPGAGIIYVATRKGCHEVAEAVESFDQRGVGLYHAGLAPDQRRSVQEEFMDGRRPLIVATNAFGMGIDKADVRFVVHFNLPGTLEAYYQEAGRAGRDGQTSQCLLLYHSQDRFIQEFFIESAYPAKDVVRSVYQYLCSLESDPIEITQQELKEKLDLKISNEGVGTCERLLQKAGAIERLEPHRNMAILAIDSDLPTLVDVLPKQAKTRRKVLAAAERIVGDQRHQHVYFSMQRLTKLLPHLTAPNLSRTLRELRELKAFQFIPPFRGRAIRVTNRQRPFDDLDLDFQTMEQRKRSDYEKLERMVHFATTRGCRQETVLRYFGDPAAARCGNCDNCVGHDSPSQSDRGNSGIRLDSDPTIKQAVLMALSAVARAKERFGATIIAATLCGSKSSKITKWNLQRLPTFGLLNQLKQTEANQLLNSLIEAKLLIRDEVDRFRPVLRLSETGRQVMLGRAVFPHPIYLPDPIRKKIQRFHPAPEPQPRESANVSQNGTTPALTSASPKASSSEDADDLNGEEDSPAPRPAIISSECEIIRPAYYWTWCLFDRGFTWIECLAIRQLTREQIVDHLLQAAENGFPIHHAWALSPTQIQCLQAAFETEETSPTSHLLRNPPEGMDTRLVRYFLKCLGSAEF